ncbi:MAG: metallophosphoesterase [Candidatus Limnocylindria bacterium]
MAAWAFAAPAASSANLLLNSDFEADANGDNKPDAWKANTYFTRSAAVVHGGSFAGRWQSTSNNGPSSYQQVNVSAGANYTVGGWVNIPATADSFTFQIKLQWRSASGAISANVIRNFTDDTAGAWQQVTGTVIAPTGATAARVQMITSSLKGTIYVDDITLAPITTQTTPSPNATTSPVPTPTPSPGGSGAAVLVGAGDIGNCTTTSDEATAKLLGGIAGTVFTAGDAAYPDGATSDFSQCYDPTWGRHKARTRPAPGNHEYHQSGAAPYYAYFGSNAGPSGQGYYAYNLGGWRVYSLNSSVVSSDQTTWLRNDLAANAGACVVAYYHHPRYATGYADGSHKSNTSSEPLWDALADAGADLVMNGHSHQYERFSPNRGITEVIVGTGGTGLDAFGQPIAGSVVRNATTHGVLKVTLNAGSYSGQFVPIAGQTFTDSFSGSC